MFQTRRNESTKGRHSVQKIIVAAFLKSYACVNGLECSRGKGSRDETLLRLLPSDTTKVGVHGVYQEQWREILSGLSTSSLSVKLPQSPISYNPFVRYWKE